MVTDFPSSVTWGGDANPVTATCAKKECVASKRYALQPGRDYCEHMSEFFKKRGELVTGDLEEMREYYVPLLRAAKIGGDKSLKISLVTTIRTGVRDNYGNLPFTFSFMPKDSWPEYVEYLATGSGIWAARNSILQYLYYMYKHVPACKNEFHSIGSPLGKTDTRVQDAKRPDILANVLTLLETEGRTCYNCSTDNDFVPDF